MTFCPGPRQWPLPKQPLWLLPTESLQVQPSRRLKGLVLLPAFDRMNHSDQTWLLHPRLDSNPYRCPDLIPSMSICAHPPEESFYVDQTILLPQHPRQVRLQACVNRNSFCRAQRRQAQPQTYVVRTDLIKCPLLRFLCVTRIRARAGLQGCVVLGGDS